MPWNEFFFGVSRSGGLRIDPCQGSDCRAECATELLERLVRMELGLFIGKSGGVWFCDNPAPREWIATHELAFCSTKHLGEKSDALPFPCPMILRWPQVGIPDAQVMMSDLLSNRDPYCDGRIFWIGADTHPSRRSLQELARRFPDIIDAEIMEWDRDAPGGQRSKIRQVSLPDHARYKYLIDCPGWGYSARTKWLLAMGRPVFMVERPSVEHWHDLLKPWIHYVPVAADLSDLLENWQRLERDPDLYIAIAMGGRTFAEIHLSAASQIEAALTRVES